MKIIIRHKWNFGLQILNNVESHRPVYLDDSPKIHFY